MPRRNVTVPAQLLLRHGLFEWPVLKIHGLDFAYRNTVDVYNSAFKEPLSKDSRKTLKEYIKLEIVITTLHYAEVLGSYLLAFEKGRCAIQRSLFKYRVSDVYDFYRAIKRKRISYIAKLFSYPQPHQINSPAMRRLFRRSCIKIKRDLSQIADYYLDYADLYNSYKHGMRVGHLTSFGEDPVKRHDVITYFTPDKSYYPAKAVVVRLDHNKAKKLSYKITALLRNASHLYLERVIERKTQMRGRLY